MLRDMSAHLQCRHSRAFELCAHLGQVAMLVLASARAGNAGMFGCLMWETSYLGGSAALIMRPKSLDVHHDKGGQRMLQQHQIGSHSKTTAVLFSPKQG